MRGAVLVVGEGGLGSDELRWVDDVGRGGREVVGGGCGVLASVLTTIGRVEVRHGRKEAVEGTRQMRRRRRRRVEGPLLEGGERDKTKEGSPS